MSEAPSVADDLAAATRACIAGLDGQPAQALIALVDRIAADLLPRLRARLPTRGGVDLQLSELASTLSIVAADPRLAHRSAAALRLARRHLAGVPELVKLVRDGEEALADGRPNPLAEDRARSELFFVAAPDRPATEAHVLRHAPRPPRVWSPAPPRRSESEVKEQPAGESASGAHTATPAR